MKTISVIVPVYKVEGYIAETVKSLMNQTFKDFELIVVDDGSPDNSASIAESLLSLSDINYQIIHTENRGVSAARNIGMEKANGQYLIMVDGDDVLAQDFLAYYAKLMKLYPKADVYSTSFTIIQGDKVIEQPSLGKDVVMFKSEEALECFYNRNPRFLLPTILLSRDFVISNSIRFDETVRYSEDVQFIWRVLAYNKKEVVHSSYSGYKYILHSGSTMTASGVTKILTWCGGFERLDKEIHHLLPDTIRELFVPMSYFAMLHGAARMLSFRMFKDVYKESGSINHMQFKGVKASPKVKIVASLTNLCPIIGYNIMKKF